MGESSAEYDAMTQSRIQRELFQRYGAEGTKILGPTQAYLRGALELGEPGYIRNAFDTARIGAGIEAREAGGGLRQRLTGQSGAALLEGLAQTGAAGGRAFIEERAGVSASQAANQIEQRNNLLRLLSGQGAQNTQLATGFGRLGLQGLGVGAQAGNPFFEAVTGLAAAGPAAYLNLLATRNQTGIPGFNAYANSTFQGGGGTVDLTGRR